MRIVVFSRHYFEYCLRYATGLAAHADVLLILDSVHAQTELSSSNIAIPERLQIAYHALHIRKKCGISLLTALVRMILFRPTVIHFQELPDPHSPLFMLACKPFAKLLLTIHDPTPHSGKDSGLPIVTRVMKSMGRFLADAYVVHGPRCQETLLNLHPEYKSKVIKSTHGVLMTPTKIAGPIDPKSFLFFGRIERYKGLEVLLEAAKVLVQRGVQHKIIIAGRGTELVRLKNVMATLPSLEVYAEYIAPEKASALFQTSGTIIMPYIDATQSGVAAAAFGNGRPVIASAVGGLPDVVHDGVNGLLVPPSDPLALANAMQRVLEDEALLDRLTAGAAASAATELNWDCIARDMYEKMQLLTHKN